MENTLGKLSSLARRAAYGVSAMATAVLGVAATHAADGIELTADVVTGAQAGIAEAVGSIEGTVNNQYLITLLVMFIGIAAAVGLVMMAVKRHRRI